MNSCQAIRYIKGKRNENVIEIPQVCGSIHNLGFCIFYDPENPHGSEISAICKNCADQNVFKNLMEEYVTLNRLKDNLYYKLRTDRAIARKNYIHYMDLITPKIDSIKAEIKFIRWNKCRLETCNQDLTNLRSKIYSLTHFSEYGKVRQIYYFCSRAHWNVLRARCGLKVHTLQTTGQNTLDRF